MWRCLEREMWSRQGWETGWTCFLFKLSFLPETPVGASQVFIPGTAPDSLDDITAFLLAGFVRVLIAAIIDL